MHVEIVCTGEHLPLADGRGGAATLERYRVTAQLFAGHDVPDPYYGEDEGFDEVLAQIEKAADPWVDRLRSAG